MAVSSDTPQVDDAKSAQRRTRSILHRRRLGLDEYPYLSYPPVPAVLTSVYATHPLRPLFHMSSAYTTVAGNSLFSDSG